MPAEIKVKGHTLKIVLDVGLMTNVKRETGVNLGGGLDQLDQVLFAEAGKLVEVLWMCVEDQAQAAGITPEEFGRAFNGDMMDSATDALIEALVDFFPRRRGRTALKAALPDLLAKVEKELNQRVARNLSIISNSAGNSPDSSESTPAG